MLTTTRVVFAVLMLADALAAATVTATDPAAFQAMEWRNIGPFRGGRATAVTGVASRPFTFYFGSTGGGVWKTDDAGTTWRNVSDGFFKTSSVGAIAVAESDPNVVYVGMGESPVRNNTTSHGDGVYKSTDGGKTWSPMGLEKTRHISTIRIHPSNPEVVYVAAQGAPWAPSADRGVYRSNDGGRNWKRVLFVDERSGACDLSLDPTNPRVLYAAFWDHQRTPWQIRSGGPGSSIHRTADGGETWKKLTGGLPATMGKIGVSVSPARPSRVFAVVEAEAGGVYRSDDSGATFERVSEDRKTITRSWYYNEIFADPKDAETVYVLNAPMLRSTDGGRTFTSIRVPHGDNHDLWINPQQPETLIEANDGGANVSFNGGRTWSTQRNQPTAQFYRVIADKRFPYRVYGGQQDNTTVGIASRALDGPGIDASHWGPVGGCESAWVGMDVKDPRYVYAGCYWGQITEHDQQTGLDRDVMVYPQQGLSQAASAMKHRFNWNAPILVSAHDPKVIYHGGNMLFRSSNRGQTWTAISGDLTRNEKDKQGAGGGPFTNEAAGAETYNTIFSIAESPLDAKVLWVGTDDGLVHVTRDGGASWTRVAPPGIGEFQVNAIEASPHDAATAYVAVTGYRRNDFAPHVFKTKDHGKSWSRIVTGLPEGSPARVVREDPEKRGLLYAGTETGAFVSFDDGGSWMSLNLDKGDDGRRANGFLPIVPVTDLAVRDGDLVASTQGRSFWILDDLSPLRQIADAALGDATLFKPRPAIRAGFESSFDGGGGVMGKNPPLGAILSYRLAKAPQTPLRLEILDSTGAVVRAYTSEKRPAPDAPGAKAPVQLSAKVGMNRVVWDLRCDDVPRVSGLYRVGTGSYRVAPGTYQARLTVDGRASTQPVAVEKDPRVAATADDFAQQASVLKSIHGTLVDLHDGVTRVRRVRDQIKGLLDLTKERPDGKPIADAGKALTDALSAWESRVVQPKQKVQQDEINFTNQLDAQLLFLSEAVDNDLAAITDGMKERLADLTREWQARQGELRKILDTDVAAFNELFRGASIPAVIVPQ